MPIKYQVAWLNDHEAHVVKHQYLISFSIEDANVIEPYSTWLFD